MHESLGILFLLLIAFIVCFYWLELEKEKNNKREVPIAKNNLRNLKKQVHNLTLRESKVWNGQDLLDFSDVLLKDIKYWRYQFFLDLISLFKNKNLRQEYVLLSKDYLDKHIMLEAIFFEQFIFHMPPENLGLIKSLYLKYIRAWGYKHPGALFLFIKDVFLQKK